MVDIPIVTVETASVGVEEEGGVLEYTFTRVGPIDSSLSVDFSLSGEADPFSDIVHPGNAVTFDPFRGIGAVDHPD